MRRVLVTYSSDERWRTLEERCWRSAVEFGRWDALIHADPLLMTPEFRERNAGLLAQARGAGFWCWKAHIIRRVLESLPPWSDLMYVDAGSIFVADPAPLFALLDRQPVVGFYLAGEPESRWSKRDLVMALGMENKIDGDQLMGGIQLYRAGEESLAFLAEYKELSQTPHLIDDSPSEMPPYGGFKEHRHDQSIFSLLYKRARYDPTFPAPSEWGDRDDARRRDLGYSKIISHPGWVKP